MIDDIGAALPDLRFGGECGRFCGGCGRAFAVARELGDRCIDLHAFRTFGHQKFCDAAFVDRLELHRRFVGLDLGQDIAGFDRIAFLDVPLGELALLHGGRERGHQDLSHRRPA